MKVLPTAQAGAATESHKYVETSWVDFDPASNGPKTIEVDELFLIKDANGDPLIDLESLNLLETRTLTQDASLALEVLQGNLARYRALDTWASEDGNRDGRVDDRDLALATEVASNWGLSSFYDVNRDGLTNAEDLRAIEQAIERQLGIPVPAVPALMLLMLSGLIGLFGHRWLTQVSR